MSTDKTKSEESAEPKWLRDESAELKWLSDEWAIARAAESGLHLEPRDSRPQTIDDLLDQYPTAEFRENE